MIPKSCADFEIAIICALPLEFDAVEALFDEHYDSAAYAQQHGDANFYRTGRFHQHNVVLACLPEMGKRSAASVASSLQCSFANIYLTLLVGICGGVPYHLGKTGETELILGDVIISSNIVEYDFGKQYPDKFQPRDGLIDTIGRDRRIQTLLAALRTSRLQKECHQKLSSYLANLQDSDRRWNYPGAEHDRLYDPAIAINTTIQALKASVFVVLVTLLKILSAMRRSKVIAASLVAMGRWLIVSVYLHVICLLKYILEPWALVIP
jgi:hypothetical protein